MVKALVYRVRDPSSFPSPENIRKMGTQDFSGGFSSQGLGDMDSWVHNRGFWEKTRSEAQAWWQMGDRWEMGHKVS